MSVPFPCGCARCLAQPAKARVVPRLQAPHRERTAAHLDARRAAPASARPRALPRGVAHRAMTDISDATDVRDSSSAPEGVGSVSGGVRSASETHLLDILDRVVAAHGRPRRDRTAAVVDAAGADARDLRRARSRRPRDRRGDRLGGGAARRADRRDRARARLAAPLCRAVGRVARRRGVHLRRSVLSARTRARDPRRRRGLRRPRRRRHARALPRRHRRLPALRRAARQPRPGRRLARSPRHVAARARVRHLHLGHDGRAEGSPDRAREHREPRALGPRVVPPRSRGSRRAMQFAPAYDSSLEESWLAFAVGATLVPLDDETVRLGPDLVPWLAPRAHQRSLSSAHLAAHDRLHRSEARAAAPEVALRRRRGVAAGSRRPLGATAVGSRTATARPECTVTVVRGRMRPGHPVSIGQPRRRPSRVHHGRVAVGSRRRRGRRTLHRRRGRRTRIPQPDRTSRWRSSRPSSRLAGSTAPATSRGGGRAGTSSISAASTAR
jgi:hypothetical protein